MRTLLLLTATFTVSLVPVAEARLFWQTFGSVTPAGDGTECTWNSNQDYFVPRHGHSCRYGLFSPCKTSCTSSPAAKLCHPLYPGYCTVYGPCRYCWRNHVYRCYCGCCPLRPYKCGFFRPYRCPCCYGCRRGCGPTMMADCYVGGAPLYPHQGWTTNMEGVGLHVLGGLPIQGDELLASVNLDLAGQQETQPKADEEEKAVTLPSLGRQ